MVLIPAFAFILSVNFTHTHKTSLRYITRKTMDALKAGVEKVKEAVDHKTAEKKLEKAADPNVKPSERLDAQFEANKAASKAAEHHAKAELHHAKHVAD